MMRRLSAERLHADSAGSACSDFNAPFLSDQRVPDTAYTASVDSTQLVIFGGTDEEQPASGNIYFFDADGQPIDPLVQ
jgi:hypothetical protein